MTTKDERIARLQEAEANVSHATLESLQEQSKKAAANMLLLYGDKSCLSATGFIYCIGSAHEACLLHLLAEGVVTLNPDYQATDEERAARAARRVMQESQVLDEAPTRHPAYL